MGRIGVGILVYVLALTPAVAQDKGGDRSASPAEQYKTLRDEYERASSSGVPLSDAERLKFVGLAYKHRYAIALKFLELAEKHPNDPIALDALTRAVWQVNATPWPIAATSSARSASGYPVASARSTRRFCARSWRIVRIGTFGRRPA
jgi:hypothetical protein